jgi:hypothetical protein
MLPLVARWLELGHVAEVYPFSSALTSEEPPIFARHSQRGKRGHRYGRNILYSRGVSVTMSGSRQAVTDGKGGRCCPVVAGRLVEDMGEMIGHSFLTES